MYAYEYVHTHINLYKTHICAYTSLSININKGEVGGNSYLKGLLKDGLL